MTKDPAFLFYPGDWLGGTMTMTRSHKGAYMDLLMAQFNEGHLSIDHIKIILGQDFDLWENILSKKFKTDCKGLFFNQKLENEVNKRKKFTDSRLKNLEKKSSHMGNHTDDHMGARMENENENENKDKNGDENTPEKKQPKWKTNCKTYEAYQQWELTEYTKIIEDAEWLKGREEFHPGLDILQTLKKAHVDFWSKKSGYKNIKARKGEDVDWTSTWANALTMGCNQVRKKQESQLKRFGRQEVSNEFLSKQMEIKLS